MRFGFASDAAYPYFKGGMEKRRYLIMQSLVKAGHEVHLFTMYREGMPREGGFVYKGVNYHTVGRATPSSAMYKKGRRNIRWPLKYALLLPLVISGYKFDLIDTDAFPFLHIPKLAAYAKITGAKFVVTWHEAWDKKYWENYLPGMGLAGYMVERLSASLTGQAIANTLQTASDLSRILKFPRGKISVFPAAISKEMMLKFARSYKKGKKPEGFIAVGRLVPEKGMEVAIRAVAQTEEKLTIIGSGPERNRLEELSGKLGMSRRIKFIDSIGEDALLLKLRNASALLMFSKREGMSIVSIEALSLGTPVIITSETSLPEEIRKYAHVIRSKDIGTGLKALIKNKRSVIYNPKVPIANVLNEFSVEKAPAIYARLLGRKPHQ